MEKELLEKVCSWCDEAEAMGMDTELICCPECGQDVEITDVDFIYDSEARSQDGLVCERCGCKFTAEKYVHYLTFVREE
ncbi:MAG: hypothetical protein WCY33_02770 [Clostridia bacterium]|jgi:uncharacterized protein YbaR (Trm112 family)